MRQGVRPSFSSSFWSLAAASKDRSADRVGSPELVVQYGAQAGANASVPPKTRDKQSSHYRSALSECIGDLSPTDVATGVERGRARVFRSCR